MTLTRRQLKLETIIKNSVSVAYYPMRSANPCAYQLAPHAQARVALS